MPKAADQLKAERIDTVVALARARVGHDRVGLVARFIRLLVDRVAPDDLLVAPPEQLYGAALSLLQLAERRGPTEDRVRVFKPEVDRHGWQARQSVVEIVTDDRPFLVDSVTAALGRTGHAVQMLIHPVLGVVRDEGGRLVGLDRRGDAPAPARPESMMHILISRQSCPAGDQAVARTVAEALADVRAAVDDWPAMRAQVRRAIDMLAHHGPATAGADATDEATRFLTWLDQRHFIFLGTRGYRFAADPASPAADPALPLIRLEPASGRGVLRDDAVKLFEGLRDTAVLPAEARAFVAQPDLVRVVKADRVSTVHRPVPLDTVLVKAFDDHGRVIGEQLFAGLFTSIAYRRMVGEVPLLAGKVARVVARAGVDPDSHDGRALLHILGTLPRDEAFQGSDDDLLALGLGVLGLQERLRTALFVRRDGFGRFLSCLVYTPRERYDTALRRRFQEILSDAFDGEATAVAIQVAESPLARLHFLVATPRRGAAEVNPRDVEARLAEAARRWRDRLRDALVEAHGEDRGHALLERYADGMPTSYCEQTPPEAAVVDLGRIEQVRAGGGLGLALFRPLEGAAGRLRLKLFQAGAPRPLSDMLPLLEHMDLGVITDVPFELRADDGAVIWLHVFELAVRGGSVALSGETRDRFHDAFLRVWAGEIEDDRFNRLVLRAELGWREIGLLRAVARYLRQAGVQFGADQMADALAEQPEIARRLVALFSARLAPERRDDAAAERQAAAIRRAIDAVQSPDEDRILRRMLNVVEATLRTNHFQPGADGAPKPWLALKLDSQALDGLPLPRPWVELFVYSPRVEAVHLRGGRVARGGVRWSDRREDVRTEVLGLMKAQMVKNAVIVPVGSKGGFVVKRPPPASAGRAALTDEAVACYRTMIRGMLDVTDTIAADGTIRPPPAVVCRDDPDPYLVVAADKGTASFSDVANEIARAYGFWLGDAFASGGSAGYDHKRMGITARGAWVAVARHFRELGRDCTTDPVTCVGVGDMGGDVFGNGMLLSPSLRLIGAFNHLHVFVDPDPDPAVALAERRRLFDAGRGWDAYDPACLSPGGQVIERRAKRVTVSDAVAARFGLPANTVTPTELIRALLTAEVDLVFFGGIGTFVKARDERDAEVGDRANDPLRVDAETLRCRVIGEGANLALTQPARIAAALGGVRLNTDAIDNAAGVDCSDHEVNIKILLDDLVAREDLTVKQRNQLLGEMTDEVADQVVTNNRQQTQALSVAEASAAEQIEQYGQFLRALEKSGRLARAVEHLPDDEDLADRARAGLGLTRPELAVVLSYAKITLYDELLASRLPDDPFMAEDLHRSFPKPLRRDWAAAIDRHKLRRELIATFVTNSLVNRLGPLFCREVCERTGTDAAAIATAYALIRDMFDLRQVWIEIEALDGLVPAARQIEMIQATIRLFDHTVPWVLGVYPTPPALAEAIAAYRPGLRLLGERLPALLGATARAALDAGAGTLVAAGVPEGTARRVAALPVLAHGVEVVRLARDSAAPPVLAVARVYYALGELCGLDWLRGGAASLRCETGWQRQAVRAIVDDLYAHQARLTARVVADAVAAAPDGDDAAPVWADAVLEAWRDARRPVFERLDGLLSQLRAAPAVDLAMLAVANRQVRTMLGG